MPVLVFAVLLQAASPAAPSREAVALGRRLAESGPLAAIAPMLIARDASELADEDPTLTASERQQLLDLAGTKGKAGMARLIAALGDTYAKRLSVADFRILVAQNENPVTVRWRAAEPAAVDETMKALGPIDFKGETAADFCRATGKLCHRK